MRGMTSSVAAKVSYGLTEDCWHDFFRIIQDISQRSTTRTVCDVGGGANPALDAQFVAREGLVYTLFDISETELGKAPAGYEKVVGDIAGVLPDRIGAFDLVFSKTLAEHLRTPERFHSNVKAMLAPGGFAVHMFPTLFAPAFVVNLLLPARVSRWLLTKAQGAQRDDEGMEGKFPAFYRWCRGPSRRQVRRLEELGFDVVEYRGYYGTRGYYKALKLAWLDDAVSRALLRLRLPAFTAFAIVVMRPRVEPAADVSA